MQLKQILGILIIVVGLAQTIFAERIVEICSQIRESHSWMFLWDVRFPLTKRMVRVGGIVSTVVGFAALYSWI